MTFSSSAVFYYCSIATFYIIYKIGFIDNTISFRLNSPSISFIIFPKSFIYITIIISLFSISTFDTILVISFLYFFTDIISIFSISLLFIIKPTSFIIRSIQNTAFTSINKSNFTFSFSFTINKFSFIDSI